MKKHKPKYGKIIDAAVIIIAENGYYQAQVSRIARQAGVADGTIYLYFKNKEDILVSLFQEKMGAFIEEIKRNIAKKTTAIDKLYVLIESHFQILSEDRHLAVVTQLELRQSDKELRFKINEVLRGYLQVIEKILIEGKANGEFSAELEVRLARQMIFGTIDETTTTWVMNDERYDLVALVEPIHRLITHGISSEK